MIIGLSGYAQSGKNTVADLLVGYGQKAFADPMREGLLIINPLIDGQIRLHEIIDGYGWDVAKVRFPEIRGLLQRLGTDFGRRKIDENVWLNIAVRAVEPHHNTVFTDVRFRNEAKAIKNLGGQVWRVTRDGVNAVNDHISEHALDDWQFDRTIENNGTIEDLQTKVKALLEP